ncbi:hypothetical protein BKM10_23780 [Pseudomonas syringae pv. syringae]|nr:hypothetical protein BKM10_23780 [Pseudomonas syringae pv. syringae]
MQRFDNKCSAERLASDSAVRCSYSPERPAMLSEKIKKVATVIFSILIRGLGKLSLAEFDAADSLEEPF